ncbi:MAG: GTPase Era [Candidatus Korobacteraceae bacterium]
MRSGFVTIIGRPNAGKSTLLNSLVGEKLAIVTHKAQTTRSRITGIVNVKRKGKRPAGQVVFVDTPGVHKPADQLNRRMMQEVYDSLEGCDLILLIVDVTQKFGTGDEFVLDIVKRAKASANGSTGSRVPATFLLLNKIDLFEKTKLLPAIEAWSARFDFAQIVPISAEKELGKDELLTAVVNALPEGPKYFPEDQITDQPERFIVAELIREQILINTAQEVPYASGVRIEKFEEGTRLSKISAVIFVEREGQKAIIIGKQGAMLKHIGTRARQQIERILGVKVYLELFVKVREGWRDNALDVDEAIDWRKQLESLNTRLSDKDEKTGHSKPAKKLKTGQAKTQES